MANLQKLMLQACRDLNLVLVCNEEVSILAFVMCKFVFFINNILCQEKGAKLFFMDDYKQSYACNLASRGRFSIIRNTQGF
jgi:hypothetical protein